jgi:hypothetical protein
MGQKSGSVKEPAKQVVKEIRRATRRQFSAEEKIRIVLTGLRGEDSIAELCRRDPEQSRGLAVVSSGVPGPGNERGTHCEPGLGHVRSATAFGPGQAGLHEHFAEPVWLPK